MSKTKRFLPEDVDVTDEEQMKILDDWLIKGLYHDCELEAGDPDGHCSHPSHLEQGE